MTTACAAAILTDAINGEENWCEWVYACYRCDPRRPVMAAIRRRKCHTGFMADFRLARAIVECARKTGQEPLLASWC